MPWRRHRICGSGRRTAIACALAAALTAGALACLLGAVLHLSYGSASEKYKRAKEMLSGYSPETVQRLSEKFRKSGR